MRSFYRRCPWKVLTSVLQNCITVPFLPLGSGIDPCQVSLCGDVVSILVVEETAEEWVRSALIINWRRHCAVKVRL